MVSKHRLTDNPKINLEIIHQALQTYPHIVCGVCIGGSHRLIDSDVIDLMGQLIDLIYKCQFRQLGCYARSASPTDSYATWWFSSAMSTLYSLRFNTTASYVMVNCTENRCVGFHWISNNSYYGTET